MKRTITDEQIAEIEALASKGLRQCDIARATGLSAQTVKYWYYKTQGIPLYTNKAPKGKKLCGTCKYMNGTCDYLIITGKRRNCPAENCTCYEKGEYKSRTVAFRIMESKHDSKNFKRLMYSQAISEDDDYGIN